MAIRNYKLEIKGTQESVTFVPRSFGDAGRDILIIKNALGAIEDYSILAGTDVPAAEFHDPNGWFDCLEGKKVSDAQAATFDNTFRDYIVKFQLDNQFYILCYYFTKYGVPQALASQNAFANYEDPNSPIEDVLSEQDIADWVANGDNRIFLSGGKSIEIEATDIDQYTQNSFLSQQIELISKMFDSEFGKLGEATLAVLHGWLPRTSLFNTGYYFDPRIFRYSTEESKFLETSAYDIVLNALYSSFVNGHLSQKPENEQGSSTSPLTIDRDNESEVDYFYELYKEQVAIAEKISLSTETSSLEVSVNAVAYEFLANQFKVLIYNTESRRPDYKSLLYQSLEQVSEKFPKPDVISAVKKENYQESLERVLEPDPFTDPDPFVINEQKMGYFLKTEYTLDNLPPLDENAENYEATIRELEDIALSYVLSFFGKPEIFYLDTRDVEYQLAFIGDMMQYFVEPDPSNETIPSPDAGPRPERQRQNLLSKVYRDKNLEDQIWVLTTQTNFDTLKASKTFSLSNRLGEMVQIFTELERDENGNLYKEGMIEPLIKFVEFRTPSLRPGDTYRAKFFINREKLNYIKDGYKPKLTVAQQEELEAFPVSRSSRIQDLCDASSNFGTSAEDNRRRYEEYRSIASKNKKEITRVIREATLEAYNKRDIDIASNVDLGVFGSIDLSNPVSSFSQLIGGFDANTPVEDPDHAAPGELSITYSDLVDRCQAVSKDLSSAYDFSLQDKIQFLSPKNFNGAEKAFLLSNLPIEVRQCIVKNGDSKFNFGDTPMGIGDGNYLDVNPLSNFTGIGQDEIKFKFKNHPTQPGLILEGIKAGSVNIFEGMTAGSNQKIFNEFPSLIDPIVVNYLARIEEMSGGPGGIASLFSPTPVSCRDLGIGRRGLGYLSRYTPGLKGDAEDFDVPIKQWWASEVADPFNEWVDNSFNFKNLVEPQFDTDAFLAILGKQCSLTKLYSDFKDKISLSGFICNVLKCLNLPAINLSIPNLNLPPIPPKFNIFGWYTGLISTMLKKFFEIIVRLLCSLIQFILDYLSTPFCENNIRDELFGELSGQTPLIQQALVDGLLDLGISKENMLPAKDFVAGVLAFLTGAEICALLNGDPIDSSAMAMIQDLAIKKGLEELSSPAAIKNFFQTLSIMLPDFCSDLEAANWVISITDCDDTTSAAEQYRRKMMAGEATEDDMNKALDLLDKNLQDQLDRLQALGEQGIKGLLPDVVNFGDPDAILNKLPDAVEDQANETMKKLFEPVKMGYLSSLSSFGPGLFLDSPRMPMPGDEEFDLDSFITVSTILKNLSIYSELVEQHGATATEQQYISQLNALHMIYEIDDDNGLAAYEWVGTDASGNPTTFDPRTNLNNFYAGEEDQIASFSKLTIDQIPTKQAYDIIYKPIGYAEDFYFSVDESDQPVGKSLSKSDGKDKFKLSNPGGPTETLLKTDPPKSNLENFSFQINYLVEKQAEEEISGLRAGDDENQTLGGRTGVENAGKQVVITAIKNRINRMQSDLFGSLNRISTPKIGSEYLGGIKSLFSQAQETLRENQKSENELISVSGNDYNLAGIQQSVNTMRLSLNEGALRAGVKYNEFGNTRSVEFDPYSIEIYGDNMFNREEDNALTIEVCDTIPGPDSEAGSVESERIYKKAIDDLNLELDQGNKVIYTRRELFAKKIMSSLFGISKKYFTSPETSFGLRVDQAQSMLNPTSTSGKKLKDKLTGDAYSKAMEGIFEQIFFALEGSRIYDEQGYYPGLNRRVAGLMTIEDSGSCVKNRYNVSQLGLLSFEKIVTDELAKQLTNEMSKPENAPQNLGFNDEGPFEKAIKNVCFLGFVRICLVELLLKGSLAYSVWDFEGVFDEKIFEEFVFEYVKSELNTRPTMKDNWEAMASRITGIDNPLHALKRLVRNQSMKILDVSKKIYQNDPSDVVDYHNWYSKYFIPQTHCSRKIAIAIGSVAQDLAVLDIETGMVESDAFDSGLDRTTADKIYWAHPLLDESNLIIEDIDRRVASRDFLANITDLVNSNDPFFHIEHLVEVKGPLASIEGVVIPGSAITNTILNANVAMANRDTKEGKAIKKVTTFVDDSEIRTPQRMNINDARGRTNLPKLDMGIYGFQANPTLPEGAAGSAVEKSRELLATGEVDPNFYADSTEVFNVKDFKQSLNFKVTDGNMKKFLVHARGQMYFPGETALATGRADLDGSDSGIPDTKQKELHGYPPEVKKTPTKFIKKTRRIIKFDIDFVSGMFDALSVDGVEDYKRQLYTSTTGQTKFLSSANRSDSDSINKHAKFKKHVTKVEESTEYYIKPDNAEDLYNIFAAIEREKQKDEKKEILIELIDDPDIRRTYRNQGSGKTSFSKVLQNLPRQAKDRLREEVPLKFSGDSTEIAYVYPGDAGLTDERNPKYGFKTNLISAHRVKKVGRSAGFTDNSDMLTTSQMTGGKLTTRTKSNSSPITIFENKIGKFASEQDYDNAINLAAGVNEDPGSFNAPLYSSMKAKEEHWVETVYEFSDSSAVLGGIYGSFTIGETLDPAVLSFRPTGETVSSWRSLLTLLDQRRPGRSTVPVLEGRITPPSKMFKLNPRISYGRTFWPEEGSEDYDIHQAREAYDIPRSQNLTSRQDEEQRALSAIASRSETIPLLARPMGIDKLTNIRLTSKLLTRSARGGGDLDALYAPFGPTISISPDSRSPERFVHVPRGTLGKLDEYARIRTTPIFVERPRKDNPDSYRDICKIIHKKPSISISDRQELGVSHKRWNLLPPNIYKIPLRVLVTQVYVGDTVEKVYAKVVPPKYIKNLKNRRKDEDGNYNEQVQENRTYLNKAIQNICNEYVELIEGDLRSNPAMANSLNIDFTQDFYTDFGGMVERTGDVDHTVLQYRSEDRENPGPERRELPSLDLDSPNQYCSIERIYSEAFHIETRSTYWNSKTELDKLFSEDRGNLLFRTTPRIDKNTLKQLSTSERVCYLESLNYFYDIPKNRDLKNAPAMTFHRTIFSLNNVLQWFLRFRRVDSLWGMLTPQDSKDATTTLRGYGGRQRFPLSKVGGGWKPRKHNPQKNNSEPLRSPWQMGFFENSRSSITADRFYVDGYRFGNRDLSFHYRSVLYPENAICLDHSLSRNNSFRETLTGTGPWERIVLDVDNGRNKKLHRARVKHTEAARYMYPLDESGNRNILYTMPLLDGHGDHYVNYNRLPSLPILQNGGSLFAMDGRVSMDDISLIMKTKIFNIFSDLSDVEDQETLMRVLRILVRFDKNFIYNKEGNVSVDNYKFIKKVLLSLDESDSEGLNDIEINIEGIDFEAQQTMENYPQFQIFKDSINSYYSGNRGELNSRIDQTIERIEKFLGRMVRSCGQQLRYQVFLENSAKDSIFSSNQESIKQLSVLKKFVEKINSINGRPLEKLYLLALASNYDFSKTIINSFSPGSTFSNIQKQNEADWAMCCLLWFQMWMAGNHRNKPMSTDNNERVYKKWFRTEHKYFNHRYIRWHRKTGQDNGRTGQRLGGSIMAGNGLFTSWWPSYQVGRMENDYGRDHRNDEYAGNHYDVGKSLTPEKTVEALDRLFPLVVDVSHSTVESHGGDTPSGNYLFDYKFRFRASHVGPRSIEGKHRFTHRVFGTPGNRSMTTNRMKAFLEGGDWNYDWNLRRPLTNREIIDYVYEVVKFALSSGEAQWSIDRSDFEKNLYGGGGTAPSIDVNNSNPAQYVEVIKSGLKRFTENRNIWKTTDTRDIFTTHGRGSKNVYINKRQQDWITDFYKKYIEEKESYKIDTIGITDQTAGVQDAVVSMYDAILAADEFKETLYLQGTTNSDAARRWNVPEKDIILILGRELYYHMYPDERDTGIRDPAEEAVRRSPRALRGYTWSKLKHLYSKKRQDQYKKIVDNIKVRHIKALEAYTNIDSTVDQTLFDQAAVINNQVMNGLFENSKIDQVCRLVVNLNNLDQLNLSDDLSSLIKSGLFQIMSEEQRSILMGKSHDLMGFTEEGVTLSVPVSEYREPISKFGMTGEEAGDNFLVSCYGFDTLVEDFEKKTSWMAQELLAKDSSKLFMKYLFPTKRYQAIATIFATTSMSGYTTMPALMRAPKASLAFLMGISSMTSKERMQMFKNMSQAELFKTLSDNKSSEPQAMRCFDLPFNEDFLENFLDLLWEQIKEFPAVLFRGLANVIDPAYKEMKMHYDACDIRNMTFRNWPSKTAYKGLGAISGGAHGDEGDKKYASLLVTSGWDFGWSVGKLFSDPSTAAKGLGRTVSRLSNYIYKGPLSLLDGNFQFQLPCKDEDISSDWPGQFGQQRYGHPFTPLTYIALAMPELRGDKRLRQMSGRCLEDFDENGPLRNRLEEMSNPCPDGEDPPFGDVPEPKDFEE